MAATERSRSSKWDDPAAVNRSRSSLEAAAEAAARVNAMLIAKGKLKPSQLSQQQTHKPKPAVGATPTNMVLAEVDINDVPIGCRNMLTRGSTQDQISKMSGAAVSTRGRYMSPEDRARNNMGERPLYLCVQGPTQESVDVAVNKIRAIISEGMKTKRFPAVNPVVSGPRPALLNQPPPLMSINTQPTGLAFVQDKLYIGLEHAPPSFDVKNKLTGPGGMFLIHIQNETGAKVILRGKGSGFLEPTSGREAFEPMHVHIQHGTVLGLQQARQLSDNLIQTVQQEYAQFQQALAALPPAISPGTATLLAGIQQQTGAHMAVINQPPPAVPVLPSASVPPPLVNFSQMAQLAAPSAPQSVYTMPQQSMQPQVIPAQSQLFATPITIPAQGQQVAHVSIHPGLQVTTQPGQQVTLQSGQAQLTLQPPPGQILPPAPGQMTAPPPQIQHVGLPPQTLTIQPGQVMEQPPPSHLPPGITLTQPPPPVSPAAQLPPATHYYAYTPQPTSMTYSLPGSMQSPVPVTSVIPLVSVPQQQAAVVMSHSYSMPPPTVIKEEQAASPGIQPQKRRFTEEKQEDKVPDNLLGYQHGPPHLTNLVTTGPPPPPSSQTQAVGEAPNPQGAAPPQQGFGNGTAPPPPPPPEDVRAQAESTSQHSFPSSQSNGSILMPPPPPPPPIGSIQTSSQELDKQLMPPPPLPGVPGHSPNGEPDRKRVKGALGNVTAYGSDDEEDPDVNSSMRQHQRDAAKYSYNQYSGKPQIYNQQGEIIQGATPAASTPEQVPPLPSAYVPVSESPISFEQTPQYDAAPQQPEQFSAAVQPSQGQYFTTTPPPQGQFFVPSSQPPPVQSQPPTSVQFQNGSIQQFMTPQQYQQFAQQQQQQQQPPPQQLPPPPQIQQPPPQPRFSQPQQFSQAQPVYQPPVSHPGFPLPPPVYSQAPPPGYTQTSTLDQQQFSRPPPQFADGQAPTQYITAPQGALPPEFVQTVVPAQQPPPQAQQEAPQQQYPPPQFQVPPPNMQYWPPPPS